MLLLLLLLLILLTKSDFEIIHYLRLRLPFSGSYKVEMSNQIKVFTSFAFAW